MNASALFRLLSLFAVTGSMTGIIVGGGAVAMPLQQTIPMSATPQPVVPAAQQDIVPTSGAQSSNALNWAGYVATGATYTSVSGSWVVPSVQDGGAGDVADATWVGIGGVLSTDLIQAGTEAVPGPGGISYQAWLELLPGDSKVIPLVISPGDSVAVSIAQVSSGLWNVTFEDATTGGSFQTTVHYDSSLSSADWIEEMPVQVGSPVKLDDFVQVNFAAGYAIANGSSVSIGSSGATALTMTNDAGEVVATPSALGPSGASFTVSRTDAASTPLSLSRNGQAVPVVSGGQRYAYAGGYGGHERRGRYRIIVFQF